MASDGQLVASCRDGELRAFRELVLRYQGLVCAVAYSSTGDRALSEDVAQETFVAAWRQMAELREPDKVRGWLCQTARHLSARARRRRREIVDPGTLQDGLAAAEKRSPSTSPLDVALDKESERLVWAALAAVPESLREVLVLFYREGLKASRVADVLGISESAVQQRLSRGRQRLKKSVHDLVERTLRRGKPGKGFVLGVLASIATAGSTAATAATAATTATTATAGATATTTAAPAAASLPTSSAAGALAHGSAWASAPWWMAVVGLGVAGLAIAAAGSARTLSESAAAPNARKAVVAAQPRHSESGPATFGALLLAMKQLSTAAETGPAVADSERPGALFEQGRALWQRRDCDEAIDKLTRLINDWPRDAATPHAMNLVVDCQAWLGGADAVAATIAPWLQDEILLPPGAPQRTHFEDLFAAATTTAADEALAAGDGVGCASDLEAAAPLVPRRAADLYFKAAKCWLHDGHSADSKRAWGLIFAQDRQRRLAQAAAARDAGAPPVQTKPANADAARARDRRRKMMDDFEQIDPELSVCGRTLGRDAPQIVRVDMRIDAQGRVLTPSARADDQPALARCIEQAVERVRVSPDRAMQVSYPFRIAARE